jgi:hypothetical protein
MPATVFTPEEVYSLNGYQNAGVMHPFTCGGGHRTEHPDGEGLLVATVYGWVCPYCDYRQDWAHPFMTNGGWRNSPLLRIEKDLHKLVVLKDEFFEPLALGLEAALERIELLYQALDLYAPGHQVPPSKAVSHLKATLANLRGLGIMPARTSIEKEGGDAATES